MKLERASIPARANASSDFPSRSIPHTFSAKRTNLLKRPYTHDGNTPDGSPPDHSRGCSWYKRPAGAPCCDIQSRTFSHLDESVFRHGGIPHQIGPSRVILRAVHGNTQISDHTTHQCLHDVIGNIVLIGLAEIGLHDVAEDVKATRCHLFFGTEKV